MSGREEIRYAVELMACTNTTSGEVVDGSEMTALEKSGEVDPEDQNTIDQTPIDGSRLLSPYRTLKGVVICVFTEAESGDGQRASTCLTMPSDYKSPGSARGK